MKVKIGNTIYDSEIEPVLLIFSKDEANHVTHKAAATKGHEVKYLTYPVGDKWDMADLLEWSEQL